MVEGEDQSLKLPSDLRTLTVGCVYLCLHILTTYFIHTHKKKTSAMFETYYAAYYMSIEMCLIHFLFIKNVYT